MGSNDSLVEPWSTKKEPCSLIPAMIKMTAWRADISQ